MTGEEFAERCRSVVEMTAEKDRLEAEIKKAKAEIAERLGGQALLVESGYEVRLKHAVRDTPQIKAINERLGADLSFETAPECFRRSEYDVLTVKRLLVEG